MLSCIGLEPRDRSLKLDVADRAISLAQLRQLRNWIMRLCKAGLLVDNRDPVHPHRLSWPEVNMHFICQLIIKKIIKQSASRSWVEHVAGGPQPPTYFVTHNWSMPFRDFMGAVEIHAKEVGVRPKDTYWICVFAINQWEVDVGSTIETSPFVEALKKASAAVLMLDKRALTLTRVWCLLEIYVILTKNESLLKWKQVNYHILTPTGMIGSRGMASSPLTVAIKNADCTESAASNEADQRRIDNYIAGIDEMTALIVDAKDGSLQLDPLECEQNEVGQYCYQQHLHKSNKTRFEHFNEAIRNQALKQIGHQEEAVMSVCQRGRLPIDLRGLTLAQLREMSEVMKAHPWKGEHAPKTYEAVTIYDYENDFMVGPVSYKEQVDRTPREADYFISVAFSACLHEVFACIEWHAEARRLPDSTVYWTWFFALTSKLEQSDLKTWNWQNGSPTDCVMPRVDGMLLVLTYDADRQVSLLSRFNPMFEVYQFLFGSKSKHTCDLACVSGILATSQPFSRRSYEFGSFAVGMAWQLLDFDVLKLIAHDAARRVYLNTIAGVPLDSEILCTSAGYDQFNSRMRQICCGIVLRQLAMTGDVAMMESVLRQFQPRLNVQTCGDLGQSPLMVASSSGNVSGVKLLLNAAADPNADDEHGETALHYAAMAGQTECCMLLLRAGARSDRISVWEEYPVDVALANPAGFLGIDTSSSIPVLQSIPVRQVVERAFSPDRNASLLALRQSAASGGTVKLDHFLRLIGMPEDDVSATLSAFSAQMGGDCFEGPVELQKLLEFLNF